MIQIGRFEGEREAKTALVTLNGESIAHINVINDEEFQSRASMRRTMRFSSVEVYAIGKHASDEREATFATEQGYTRATGIKAAKALLRQWFGGAS